MACYDCQFYNLNKKVCLKSGTPDGKYVYKVIACDEKISRDKKYKPVFKKVHKAEFDIIINEYEMMETINRIRTYTV